MRVLATGILAIVLHSVLLTVPDAGAQSAKTQLEDPVLATRFNAVSAVSLRTLGSPRFGFTIFVIR